MLRISGLKVSIAFCVLSFGVAQAQTTWLYTECTNGSATTVSLPDYSVDSTFPNDPVAGGERLGSIAPASLTAVNDQTEHEGGIAVDRINKVVVSTNGDATSYTFYEDPISTANCSPGLNARSWSPAGTAQLTDNLIGIAISYHKPSGMSCEEPEWLYVSTREEFARIALGANVEDDLGNPITQHNWDTQFGSVSYTTASDVIDIAYGLAYEADEDDDCEDAVYQGMIFGLRQISPTSGGVRGFKLDGTVGPSILTTGLEENYAVALDTSRPVDLDSTCESVTWWLSGTPLVHGKIDDTDDDDEAVIRRILRPKAMCGAADYEDWVPLTTCNGAGDSEYVGAMAYSAEVVSLGNPCGPECSGLTTSRVLADIDLPDTSPCQSKPGQSVTYVDGSGPDFDVIACTGVPSNSTPYLLVQKNGYSSSTHNSCTIAPNPSGLGTYSIAGTLSASIATVSFNSSTVPGALSFPSGSPLCPDTKHYFYCQWIFMCGGTSVPLNVATGTWQASEPFRFALSNVQ